jgi:hypothetical protein
MLFDATALFPQLEQRHWVPAFAGTTGNWLTDALTGSGQGQMVRQMVPGTIFVRELGTPLAM